MTVKTGKKLEGYQDHPLYGENVKLLEQRNKLVAALRQIASICSQTHPGRIAESVLREVGE